MRRIPRVLGEPVYIEFIDGYPEMLSDDPEGKVTLLIFHRRFNGRAYEAEADARRSSALN